MENHSGDEKINKLTEQFTNADPNVSYSKFMKFMHQEGNLPQEIAAQGASKTDLDLQADDSKWTEEFLDKQDKTAENEAIKGESVLNEVEVQSEAAGTWVDEFLKKDSSATGNFAFEEKD